MQFNFKEKSAFNRMEVAQVTLNPNGPGAVRLHLVPPKKTIFKRPQNALIFVNGNDILPLSQGHTVLMYNFFDEINKYDGQEISDEELEAIVKRTVATTRKVYYRTSEETMIDDLQNLIEDFCRLAYGQPLESEFPFMSLSEYHTHMTAPHRMDLMVSAMTTPDGCWKCNNKCLHCYAADQLHSSEKELTTEEWKKVIDICRKAGIVQLTFTGGEPTLRKDLFELIKYARFFVSRVNTNGLLLTKEYCEKLFEAELDSLQVTFYSHDADVHNRLVGNSHGFEKTLAGIKNAINAGLSVSINTPLCTLNADYIETLKLPKSLGITYVSCSSLITTGNALKEDSEKTQLSPEELEKILKEATVFCEENKMELAFTSPGWLPKETITGLNLKVPTCGACLSNMAVTPSGEVVPCQSWLNEASLGNILTDDWHRIWNGMTCTTIRYNSAEMEGICPLRKKDEVC